MVPSPTSDLYSTNSKAGKQDGPWCQDQFDFSCRFCSNWGVLNLGSTAQNAEGSVSSEGRQLHLYLHYPLSEIQFFLDYKSKKQTTLPVTLSPIEILHFHIAC